MAVAVAVVFVLVARLKILGLDEKWLICILSFDGVGSGVDDGDDARSELSDRAEIPLFSLYFTVSTG